MEFLDGLTLKTSYWQATDGDRVDSVAGHLDRGRARPAHAVGTADRFRQYCDFGSSRMYPKLQEASFWYVGGIQDRDVQ